MSPEKTEKLYNDFPLLYVEKDLPATESCMYWGFACGDGWFDILYTLSQRICELADRLELPKEKYPKAVQVKEKFGSLVFYLENGTDEMREFVREAVRESLITCENDGTPGKLRRGSWLRVLCDDCVKKSNGRYTLDEESI